MSNEIKIGLVVDASGAIANTKDFSRTLSSLRNQVIATDQSFRQGEASDKELNDAVVQYISTLKRQLSAMDATTEGSKRYSKAISSVRRELQSILTYTNTDFSQKPIQDLMDQIKTAEAELEKIRNAEKLLQEQVDDRKLEALDKKVHDLSKRFKELNIQLEESVKADIQNGLDSASEKTQNLAKQVNKVQAELAKAQHVDIGTRIKNLVSSFVSAQAVVWALRTTLNAVRKTLKESAEAAGEAEQVYSKLSTVFDGLSSAMSQASSLASKLGTAVSTSASAISTIGDLLQAQGMGVEESLTMAADWAEKLQDIIAFKDLNMSLDEFAQTFMSGAMGNLRNFRTFGSIVKESAVNARIAAKGLEQLTGDQLELAKVTARAEIALEQQANAMGATNREWNTTLSINRRLAEATKQWKENLGATLNAKLNPIKSAWTNIITEINKATEAQKQYNEAVENGKPANIDVGRDVENNANDLSKFLGEVASNLLKYYPATRKSVTYLKDVSRPIEQNYPAKNGGIYTGQRGGAAYDAWLNAYENDLATYEEFVATINKQIVLFQTDVETLNKYQTLSEDLYKDLIALQEERNRLIQLDIDAENRRTSITTANKNAQDFAEIINGLKGISISIPEVSVDEDSRVTKSDELTESIISGIQTNVADAIEDMFNLISPELWQNFVNKTDLFFGDATQTEGIQQMQEELKTVYEAMLNYFTLNEELASDGSKISENENRMLQQVVDKYNILNTALDDIAKAEEDEKTALENAQKAAEDFANALSSLSTGKANVLESIYVYNQNKTIEGQYSGYSQDVIANEKSRASDKRNAELTYNTALLSAVSDADKAAVLEAYNSWVTEIDNYYNLMRSDIEAAEKALTDENIAAAFDTYSTATSDKKDERTWSKNTSANSEASSYYQASTSALESLLETLKANGYTEDQLKELQDKKLKEITSKCEGIAVEIQKQTEAEYNMTTLKDSGLRAAGEAGKIADSAMQGFENGGIWGAIIGAVAEILEVIDAFETLNAVLDPIIEGVLKPLGPVIKLIGDIVGDHLYEVLRLLFPVIKALSKALVVLLSVADIVSGFIIDTGKKIVGTIMYGITQLINGVIGLLNKIPFVNISKIDNSQFRDWMYIDILGNVADKWDRMNDYLAEIDAMSMEIADNTSEDDDYLKAYQELLHKGLITNSQMADYVNSHYGTDYGTTKIVDGAATYSQVKDGTYIQKQNVTIQINGTNLTLEQIKEVIRDALTGSSYSSSVAYI